MRRTSGTLSESVPVERIAGISLMPGTASAPAFRRVDIDVKTGKVSGLF